MAKHKTTLDSPQAISRTVPLSQLRAGDAINARRTNRADSIDELKASLLAHGLVQSLRVRLIGESHYEVVAGNRRLVALQALAAEGKISPDFEVAVIAGIIDDGAAHELSIAENVERVPVSPVDEFKAYGRLHQDGKSADEVAARFGVPLRRVQQRMKLAALHPTVLAALEGGKIGLDTAQSFTVAEPDRQLTVFNELSKRGGIYAYEVKQKLTDTSLRSDSRLAQLVGEAAYLEAGGEIVTDLFAENSYWTSPDVVRQLVDAAWADRVQGWLAAGWAWVKPEVDVPDIYYRDRVRPTKREPSQEDLARMEAIQREQDEFDTDNGLDEEEEARWNALDAEADAIRDKTEAYAPEDMAKAGVVYWPGNGRVEYGVGEPRAGSPAGSSGAAPEKKALDPEDPAAVGPTVSETLSAVLSDSLRTEVAADPDLALPLLAAFMAVGQGGGPLPAHLTVGSAHGRSDGKQGIAAAFRYFDEMPDEELLAAIARMFANTIDVKDSFLDPAFRYSSNTATGRQKLVADLVEIVEPRTFPEFNAAGYFTGVKKPLIAAAFLEITGEAIKDGKKADMAATAAKLAVEHGWLPILLRSRAYDGPGAAVSLAEAAE